MRCFFNQTGTSEPTVYTQYLYAGGTRVKKITRKSSGDKYITVYIDGIFEHSYHLDGSNDMDEELNELHIMDDQTRVAMLRTGYDDGTPFTKYILSDHLGSSNVILETSGAVYNREEYYPFGETSFGAFGKKRYRYVGKEKDEESGLYYYGARYFQPWSCRFISVDPLAADYPFYTPYQYAGNKPINFIDLDGAEEKPAPLVADPSANLPGEITLSDPKGITEHNKQLWSMGSSSETSVSGDNILPKTKVDPIEIGSYKPKDKFERKLIHWIRRQEKGGFEFQSYTQAYNMFADINSDKRWVKRHESSTNVRSKTGWIHVEQVQRNLSGTSNSGKGSSRTQYNLGISSGTLLIEYDMQAAPDRLQILNAATGAILFDTANSPNSYADGSVKQKRGSGQLVSFNLGVGNTQIIILVNGGVSTNPDTIFNYNIIVNPGQSKNSSPVYQTLPK